MVARAVFLALAVVSAANRSLASESNSPSFVGAAVRMQRLIEADWIEQDRLFAATMVKPGEPVTVNARGVTTRDDATGAVDGVKNGRFGFHVAVGEKDPWWQVELGRDHPIDRVVIYIRTDGNHAARTRRIGIQVAGIAHPARFETVYRHDGTVFFGANENKPLVVRFDERPVTAGIVRLFVDGECHLALDEVEVYSAANPRRNIALGKPADQKSVSRHSVPGTAGETPPPAVPRDGGFQLAHTRDVIRRALDLAARLRAGADPARLNPLVTAISRVECDLAKFDAQPLVSYQARKRAYFEARRLLRRIAFCNPSLDFDRLLFIKRHRGSLPRQRASS